MSKPVIEVHGLSKSYQLGTIGATSLREEAAAFVQRLKGNAPKIDKREFWALRDVSFDIQPGEVVGFIGRNGAGKSTLLKLLSRITEPTSGRAIMRGRVASLLEVGTGFHPELSGRDNVFLNGAILGMTRAEVRAKFDEIVAFAEIEQFIDTPVKRYSSGMYVRLAFAVAAHLEPEILIVDEVLAVGDAQFQKKCLGKMRSVSSHGRTVLFVSHNMGVVANLCSRAIMLSGGTKVADGEPEHIVQRYIADHEESVADVTWTRDNPAAGTKRMRLCAARLRSDGEVRTQVEIDRPVELEYEFEVLDHRQMVTSNIQVSDKHGVLVFSSSPPSHELDPGRYQHRVEFPADFFNDGLYSVTIMLMANVTLHEVVVRDAIVFAVHETGAGREQYGGAISGCLRPKLKWHAAALPIPAAR